MDRARAPPYRYRDIERLPDPEVFDASALADAVAGHLANDLVPEEDKSDAEHFVRKVRRLLDSSQQGARSQIDPVDE